MATLDYDRAACLLSVLNAHDVTRLALTCKTWAAHVRRYRRKLVRIEWTRRTSDQGLLLDPVWIFEAPGSDEAPLRVNGVTLKGSDSSPLVTRPYFPVLCNSLWLKKCNAQEVPDEAWIALARAFPGEVLQLTTSYPEPTFPKHLLKRVASLVYKCEIELCYGPTSYPYTGDFPEYDDDLDELVDSIKPSLDTGSTLSLEVDERLELYSEDEDCIYDFYKRLHDEHMLEKLDTLKLLWSEGHYPDAWLPFCGYVRVPHLRVLEISVRDPLPATMDWPAAFDQLKYIWIINVSTNGAFERRPIASILNAKVRPNLEALWITDVDDSIVDVEWKRFCPNLSELNIGEPFESDPPNATDLIRRLARNVFHPNTNKLLFIDFNILCDNGDWDARLAEHQEAVVAERGE